LHTVPPRFTLLDDFLERRALRLRDELPVDAVRGHHATHEVLGNENHPRLYLQIFDGVDRDCHLVGRDLRLLGRLRREDARVGRDAEGNRRRERTLP
jgi:hypothetical protein